MKLRSGNRTLTDATMADGDSSETMEQKKLDRTVSIFGKRISYILLIIHINMAIYAGCFFIQAGTLPYLSKRLGVDVTMFGYLQTMFAVVQLCGGPLFGRFGDLFGGRAALTLAFASAGLSYGLMGLAYSFPMLLLSRLPSIFMHAMQGGQMVVTDMTETEKRADALGKLGVSYGIGMVIGPFIGGIVNTHLGENEAALVACGGSILSMLMCYLLLPVKTKKSQSEAQATQEKQVEVPVGIFYCGKADGSAVFDLKKIVSLLKGNPRAMQLLAVKTVTGIPLGIFQSMFAVFAMETFKLAADQNGYIMSYIGILSMLIQGVGIGIMTKHFTENTLIKWASFILIWSWLLMSFVQNVWQLMVVMVPKCFGLVILNVVVSSTLTKTVSDADTGTMLGLNMAVHSLVGTISPTIGGIIMARYGFRAISYLGVVASSLVFVALTSQSTSTMLGINMATNSLIRTVSPTIGGLMLHHWGFASFGYLGCLTSIGVSIYLFTKIKH